MKVYTQLQDNAKISSDLIVKKVDNVAKPIDYFQYKTSEQFTGRYWIDGKKIYCNVITKRNIALSDGVNIAHGISNINQVIDYDVATWHTGSGTLVKYYSSASGSSNGLSVRLSKTDIQFVGNDTWAASTSRVIYAIIYYTKTTD